MKKHYLIIGLVLILSYPLIAQSTIREYNKAFTTYPFSDPNPIPSSDKIYPYFRFDGFTNKSIQKEWKVVELENQYIKLIILPEIGGKIWTAIEKSSNRPYIYYNQVVKFRDVAMRGAWTSGGIEPNYGIIGHAPSCATPVDYLTLKKEDGSVSCIVGSLDLLTMTNWRVEINLPGDKAYFTTSSFWHNSNPLEEPYYNWMNAAIKSKGNLEFIYPGTNYIGHGGEVSDWPVNKENGKNISFYENNNFGGSKSYHVLGTYSNFYGGYWHADDFGMINYSPHEDKAGKKAWIWSLSRSGMIWEDLLTDKDGQYVEVQSGRLHNQNAENSTFTPFKHRSFSPYLTDKWIEYWYPVLKTEGVVEANEYGALNIKYEKGWLKIYFSPLQSLKEKLVVQDNNNIVYSKNIELSPLKTFKDSLQVNLNPSQLTVSLGENKMVFQAEPDLKNLHRPLLSPQDFDWNSTYGLYIQGEELMDQRLYKRAEEKLYAVMEKDHNYFPALVKLAELKYRNIQYNEALDFAKRALSIDTYNGAANFYYGLINNKLGNIADAKDGFDFASQSYEYRSAAYTELSKIYFKEKNLARALTLASKALDFSPFNITACEMRAIIYRYMNDPGKAVQEINKILSLDPLNHFAMFENCMYQPAEENKVRFTSLIRTELSSEIYFEIAAFYYDLNCLEETEKVLQLCPSNSQADYWMAFIRHKQGKDFSTLLEKAVNSPAEFVFPFRTEMAEVFQWTIGQTGSWKPKYFLALIYKNRNRSDESEKLLASCKNLPDFAPFYATRAESVNTTNLVLEDLKRANELNKNEWRYKKLLSEYYIQHQQYNDALALLEPFYHTNPQNYIIGMQYAKSLLLSKKFKECDALLAGLEILPFEGASDGRELYFETKLMLAMHEMQAKNYKNALKIIESSRIWPENLGVGKPYEDNIDERLEDWLSYLCYSQLRNTGYSKNALQKIKIYTDKMNKSSRNLNLTNTMVSLWTIEKLGTRQEAIDWLNQQISKNPADKTLIWCKQSYEMKNKPELPAGEKDSSIRLLEQLLLLSN